MVKDRNYNENILDVFRILATVQVFMGHMISHFSMPAFSVNVVYFIRGVPILFALCGFLAAMSLEKYTVKQYLKQRAIRILPAFWVCIVINTVLILFIYDTKPTTFEAIIYVVTQFFGLNFYTGDWLRGYGVGTPNGVLWTIAVQIQFYLLAPIVKKMFSGKSLKFALACIFALALCSIGIYRMEPYLPELVYKLINVTVLPYSYFLVLGMVLWFYREQLLPVLVKARWTLAAAYVIWKLAEMCFSLPHILDGVLYNTVTTLLLVGSMFGFSFAHKWRAPCDYTYGFYLYHMVFINLAVHMGRVSAGWIETFCIAGITLVAAWLSQRFVEIPVVKRLKKRG